MATPPHFGKPITRFVAPAGAPPKAPVAVFACARRANLERPSRASLPQRAFTEDDIHNCVIHNFT
eukprot:877788-Pyramimonas_sp.AAC.1